MKRQGEKNGLVGGKEGGEGGSASARERKRGVGEGTGCEREIREASVRSEQERKREAGQE